MVMRDSGSLIAMSVLVDTGEAKREAYMHAWACGTADTT